MNITYKKIIENEEINAYLDMGNQVLGVLGYTDHSRKHAIIVAENAAKILRKLG